MPRLVSGAVPIAAGELIGRDADLLALGDLLAEPGVRLLTIDGPPGVGKTALALALAAAVADEFADGASIVLLAGLTDEAGVPAAIASAMGVQPEGDSFESVALALADREALVVLDNFEQLASAASQVGDLVVRCPGIKVVVTSRQRLHLRIEHRYAVEPLAADDAALLFEVRARAVAPDFRLDADIRTSVIELCRQLDCLPLTVELAAARADVLSVAALRARLARPLEILVGAPPDSAHRHRSVDDAIRWSYELLTDDQREVFIRLCAFRGGFTLQAAEAVAGARVEDVSDLVGRNLVQTSASGADGERRFSTLQVVREFGLAELERADITADVLSAHAAHFLELAELASRHLFDGRREATMTALDRERHNFGAALEHLTNIRDDVLAARLTVALTYYWARAGDAADGWRWSTSARAHLDGVAPFIRAQVLSGAATVATTVGAFAQAAELAGEAQDLFRSCGDRRGEAAVLSTRGHARRVMGDMQGARDDFEAALDLALASHMTWLAAYLHNRLGGSVLPLQGDWEDAAEHQSRSAALFLQCGDVASARKAELESALADIVRGHSRDLAELQRIAADVVGSRDASHATRAHHVVGDAQLLLGQPDGARHAYAAMADLARRRGASYSIPLALQGLACVAIAADDDAVGAAFFGAADGTAQRFGMHLQDPSGLASPARAKAIGRLGSKRFAAEHARGAARSLDEATAVALRWCAGGSPTRLTASELRVLRLVNDGLSNAAIAADLTISIRTVHAHLRAIYRKLDVSSRTAAARHAADAGLLGTSG